MTDKKEVKSKTTKKHVALRKLFTLADGVVKKGDECTCTEKEATLFKKVKAI